MDWDALRARIARARHAQLQLRGDRADRDDLQHHRRRRVDRADVPEPLRQVEPVGRVHRRQRVPGARPEEARPVGRGDGRRPQVLRRLARAASTACPAELRSALRHRVRGRRRSGWSRPRARRQKWIDQAQSLNIYMAGASGKKLDETYKLAWLRGLKTTYYLRTLAATAAEKSTGQGGELNAVPASGGMAAAAGAEPKRPSSARSTTRRARRASSRRHASTREPKPGEAVPASKCCSPATRTGRDAMNAKTEHWESYVDDAGRRHWRWPAAPQAEDIRGLPAPRSARIAAAAARPAAARACLRGSSTQRRPAHAVAQARGVRRTSHGGAIGPIRAGGKARDRSALPR